jgi:hypothetical protein
MIGNEAATTGTDIGNRRLRFLAYSQLSKIHDVTHFGINKTLQMEAPRIFRNGGYGAGKNQIFF